MQEISGTDELASERTLLAAQRTFSAWIRTGLAGVGGGLAVPRVLKFNGDEHLTVAHLIGALLVIWGASIIIYAIMDYRRTCMKANRASRASTAATANSTRSGAYRR